jgi:hypothetical protein
MKKGVALVALCFLFLAGELHAAQRIGSYGYEDWDGSADTTPGYPWGTNYLEYWELYNAPNAAHKKMTEIVESYASDTGGTWTAHSGRYFSLHNDSPDFPLSPSVTGIPQGSVNNNIYLGLSNPKYGGLARIILNFLSLSFSKNAGCLSVSPLTILKSSMPCKNIFIRAIADVIKLSSWP